MDSILIFVAATSAARRVTWVVWAVKHECVDAAICAMPAVSLPDEFAAFRTCMVWPVLTSIWMRSRNSPSVYILPSAIAAVGVSKSLNFHLSDQNRGSATIKDS